MKFHRLRTRTLLRPNVLSIPVLFAALFVLLSGSAATALAEDTAFVVTPVKVQIELAPGEVGSGVIRVKTTGSGSTYEVSTGHVTQSSNGVYNYLQPTKNPADLVNWIDLTPKSFVSGRGTNEPIIWKVSVPKNADAGDGHLAVVYVLQKAVKKKNVTAIQTRYAVRFEVRVRGNVIFRPVISSVKAPKVSSNGPIKISTTIANEGNARIDMAAAKTAEVQILDGTKVLKRFPLQLKDPKDGTDIPTVIFPEARRVFKFSWKDPPKYGRFTAKVVLDFPEDARRDREVGFSVVPYRTLGLVASFGIGGLLFALILVVRIIRRRKRLR